MSTLPPEAARLRPAAAAALAFVLAVVLASAAIRLGSALASLDGLPLGLLRVIHRASASLEVIVALWIGWTCWRGRRVSPALWRAAFVALVLTALLSILGIVGGQAPSRPQALGNLLGGLALAFAFAWLLGNSGREAARPSGAAGAALGGLLALQAFVGGRLSIFGRAELAMPAHALLGLGLAALLGWFALARVGGRAGKLLFALSILAPIAGFSALQYERSAAAALAHAAAAAFLVVAAAWAAGRQA